MFPLRRFTALLGFSLIGISTAHAVTLPPSSTGMSFVDIDTPISNPFVGGTLLQTLTSPQQSITNISNISEQRSLDDWAKKHGVE